MLNFELLPGDRYEGRCAEIYITEKQFLIYHCSVCEEIFATFEQLLSHINKNHYENTKECSKIGVKGVKAVIAQENVEENQLEAQELFVELKSQNLTANHCEEKKCEQTNNVYINEVTHLEVPLEMGPFCLHKGSKSLTQRKKSKHVTCTFKSIATGRTKVNPLTRYQLSYNEEWNYVCSICGFAFQEKHNLRSHLLRHSNQKNFSCSICPKKCFTKVELRFHEYRHKGEKTRLCNHCGMGFISLGSLTQHISKHHSLRCSFKCEQCYVALTNFSYLKDHQPLHCKVCKIQFIKPSCISKCDSIVNNYLKLDESNHNFHYENYDKKQVISHNSESKLEIEKLLKDTNGDVKL